METKNIILKLRTERGMSQDELANKVMVTRQAVSRWENSVTFPDITMLPLLANMFDVTVDYLLDVDTYNKEKEIPDIIVQSIVLFN